VTLQIVATVDLPMLSPERIASGNGLKRKKRIIDPDMPRPNTARNGATHCRQCGKPLSARNRTGVCTRYVGQHLCYDREFPEFRKWTRNRSGRGSINGGKPINFWASKAEIAEMDQHAKRLQITRSEWIRRASVAYGEMLAEASAR
jgi:hypothetical protein